jgi:phage gp29-like protein
VTASAPSLPLAYDSQLNFIPPPGTQKPDTSAFGRADASLVDRTVQSDPRELWYLALPYKLTPSQCVQIMRSALGGDIWQQWQLCSLMLDTWPTFRMAAHQLLEAVAYCKYAVHPYCEDGEEPSDTAKEKAGLVTRAIKSFDPNPFNDETGFSGMVYHLGDAALNGLSLVELMWHETNSPKYGREILPRAAAWVHPRHFTFTVEHTIAVFDDTYQRLFANPQLIGTRVGETPDFRKFMCAQFISRAGSCLGAGFMRPLVWYWAARQFNLEWLLNTAKMWGAPFLDIAFQGLTAEEQDALRELASVAGQERRLVHPVGATVQVHPPANIGAENPQRSLNKEADEACLFLLLGQTGTTMATPGQLGNQDAHGAVKQERIQGLANWIGRTVLRQFSRSVIAMNYGETSECPHTEADFTKPLNSVEVGGLVTSVMGSGIPVRADELYKKIGFVKPDDGDVILSRGQLAIQGEVLTEEERMVRQVQLQQEMFGEQSQENEQSGDESQRAIEAVLQKADIAALAEIDGLVKAAIAAPHINGELDAVQAKILALT